jgi:ABC-type branched-subunit amino acid transport system substrate-binding protein
MMSAMKISLTFQFLSTPLLRMTFTLLCAVCATGFLPSSVVQAAENAIVIGQAIDLSGPNGSLGRDYVAGITTYFDTINTSGGVRGRRIKYIVRDDLGDPNTSTKATTELIQKDKVDFLLGGIGTNVTDAVLASPAFAQSDLILFAPLLTSVKNYGARVLFWRPSPEQEMNYIFSYFDKLGIKKIGIAFQNTPINQDMLQYVTEEIRKRHMTMTGIVKFDLGNQASNNINSATVQKEAVALAKAEPNIVITIADTLGTGQFLKLFRPHAPRTMVAGMSLTNLQTLSELIDTKTLEWTVFSQVVPNPAGKKSGLQIEHSKMMKKFREEELSTLTLEGFAVAKTLVQAITMGKPLRETLPAFVAQKSTIDLGGVFINPSDPNRHLSSYVDIALFRKNGGLAF